MNFKKINCINADENEKLYENLNIIFKKNVRYWFNSFVVVIENLILTNIFIYKGNVIALKF